VVSDYAGIVCDIGSGRHGLHTGYEIFDRYLVIVLAAYIQFVL
jgi:hypothetical protein